VLSKEEKYVKQRQTGGDAIGNGMLSDSKRRRCDGERRNAEIKK